MKIRIELEETLIEDEIVIRCRQLNPTVLEIQKAVADITEKKKRFPFYRQDREYYLPLEQVLFFETAEKGICAHTAEEVYQVKYKLYELEKLLPGIHFWKLLLTILFGACLLKSLLHLAIPGILFALAFLGIIYAKELGIETLTPWPILGAALLLSIGLSLIFPHKRRHHEKNHMHGEWDQADVDQVEENAVQMSTKFGSSIKYVNSPNLERVNLECSFGAMKVYFDNAVMSGESATLDLQVSFGGIELYIPKDWKVENHLKSAFGGLEEKNHPTGDQKCRLVLTGSVNFAGVTVCYI